MIIHLYSKEITTQKEALHVLIGITMTGKNEIIDYALFQTESIYAYESLLTSMDVVKCYNLFTFLQFPESIQVSLYSANIIENFNKHLKRYTSHKEQFPTEDSLDRFVYARVIEYNSRQLERLHRGFAH